MNASRHSAADSSGHHSGVGMSKVLGSTQV